MARSVAVYFKENKSVVCIEVNTTTFVLIDKTEIDIRGLSNRPDHDIYQKLAPVKAWIDRKINEGCRPLVSIPKLTGEGKSQYRKGQKIKYAPNRTTQIMQEILEDHRQQSRILIRTQNLGLSRTDWEVAELAYMCKGQPVATAVIIAHRGESNTKYKDVVDQLKLSDSFATRREFIRNFATKGQRDKVTFVALKNACDRFSSKNKDVKALKEAMRVANDTTLRQFESLSEKLQDSL